jgi:hypothetical protein
MCPKPLDDVLSRELISSLLFYSNSQPLLFVEPRHWFTPLSTHHDLSVHRQLFQQDEPSSHL